MRTIRLMTTLLIAASLAIQISGQTPQSDRQAQAALQAAINKELVDGNLEAAIKQYKGVIDKYPKQRAVVADALIRMAEAYQRLGNAESRRIFEGVVSDFSDQPNAVARARTRLASLAPLEPPTRGPREVWSGPNVSNNFDLSADGRYLVDVDWATGGDFFIRDLVTNTNRFLNNVSGFGSEAVFSPDNRQVAYSWYDDANSKVDLRIASISMDSPIRTTVLASYSYSDGESFRPRAWTPDGKQLVGIRNAPDRTAQLGVFTIQDRSFVSIKSLPSGAIGTMSLSPDGRYIAYDIPANDSNSPRDIFVIARDGSGETAAVRHPANDVTALWSPDGKSLIFMSGRTGGSAVWMQPMKDGQPSGPAQRIKENVGGMRLKSLTKNGTLLYVQPGSSATNLYVATLDGARVVAQGTPATERLIGNHWGPSWSRDGQYLAYYSFRNVSPDLPPGFIVIRSTKTGEERTVVAPQRLSARAEGPKWFPDNRSILIQLGDAQGPGFGFYKLSLDTGNTELLVRLPGVVNSYDLSADGRTIFYATDEMNPNDGGRISRYDIDSQRETVVARVRAYAISLALSRDGSQLAMNHIGGHVDVMPIAGGEPRVLFQPNPSQGSTGTMRQGVAWTADGRFVLFKQDDGFLYSVPAAGGAVEAVGLSMKPVSPAIHPDGKQLAFRATTDTKPPSLMALEKFWPQP